ncbi:AcrR family transcriptional regulator [Mumia flava]|uniref:AcrR family transcriptional regulator n=1 Tax=Mumia flava TaxID=1348852 RepID=A0A0B2BTJ8_9ACTN|nr:TetR/AcrR family transcriptional regulator [Mumia flava]PJJ57962.1 AcrR family transcriptional regulator [Mumia flava]
MTSDAAPIKRTRAARVPADQRRAEILVAALDVFGTRGFHKASLGEIAERVGITHQGILHHFGSKEQLLVEVLEYRDATDVADFENAEPPHGPLLLDHLVRTAQTNTTRGGLVQSYAVLSAESVTEGHPAQDSFRDRFTHLRGMIADALADTVPADRRPPEEELDAAASSIIAVMDGLQVQWLLDPERVDMPAAVALVIDALLARWGLAARAADVL